MSRRNLPEVQAGSMADIAFLLLIFFLVTTTIPKDKGLSRKLPDDKPTPEVRVKERNTLVFTLNKEGKLLVKEQVVTIADVTDLAIAFIDNGGISRTDSDPYCDYCQGARSSTSSIHPTKAIIAIQAHREALYSDYIAVQDAVNAAYGSLRNRESQKRYGFEYTALKKQFDEGATIPNKMLKKKQLEAIRDLYPMLISEAEVQKKRG